MGTLLLAMLSASGPAAGEVVSRVHFAFRDESGLRVAGHDTHRLEVDTAGRWRFFPIADRGIGPLAGHAAFRLRSVRRGRAPLKLLPVVLGPPGAHALELSRGPVIERLANGARGVEHSVHFAAAPPGRGPLVVELDIEAPFSGQTRSGHHFSTGAASVAYGPAVWVTADGASVPVKTSRTARGLALVVPAEVVERGPYPAAIDPLVSPEFSVDAPIQRPPPGTQDHPAVAFDGTNYLVAWRDFRGSQGSDIYGTRVDQAGNVLDPGGLSLSTGAGGQYEPALTFGAGQYFLSFSDTRAGGSDIYGMRVDTNGSSLDGTGFAIGNFSGLQTTSDVGFNGVDYLVVWSDLRATPFAHIYGARVTTSGVVRDPGANLAISLAINGQYVPRTAGTDAGLSLVVWEDARNATNDIYGARVDADGGVLNPAGLAIAQTAGGQREPEVGFDGTDFFVAWTDSRSGTDDIYANRVTPAGAVLHGTGFAVCNVAGGQNQPAVSLLGSDWLVAWRDDRLGGRDIFGARVTTSGSVTDINGLPLSVGTSIKAEPVLATGPGHWMVAFTDNRSGNNDISAAAVHSATALVSDGGFNVSLAANLQQSLAVATDGTDFLLVWQDFRDPSAGIWAHRVGPSGALLGAPIPVSTAAGDEAAPAVAFDGVQYVVAWVDARSGNADIYAARVSTAGVVLDTNGVPISANTGLEAAPAVSRFGAASFVVWQDARSPGGDIYGARFSQAGVLLDDAGVLISNAANTQSTPDLAEFDGGLLVVWADGRAGNDDIYAARVNSAGAVVDATGIPVSTGAALEDSPSVSFAGGTALVAWRDGRNPTIDAYAARVQGGSVLDINGFQLSSAVGIQGSPEVVFDEAANRWTVFWEDARVTNATDLYAVDVSLLGSPTIESFIGSGRAPAAVFAAPGRGVLAYARFAVGPGLNNLRAQYRLLGDTADAGSGVDGGFDAGTTDGGSAADAGTDGGLNDAGVADAGADGGAADAGDLDAGVDSADAGTDTVSPRTYGVGCGCQSGPAGWGTALLLLALAWRRCYGPTRRSVRLGR